MAEEWVAVGKRFREAREAVGLSQKDVAETLNILRPAVSLLEAGERRINILELKEFAKLYRRPTWDLLGEEDPRATEVIDDVMERFSGLEPDDKEALETFVEFLMHRKRTKEPLLCNNENHNGGRDFDDR